VNSLVAAVVVVAVITAVVAALSLSSIWNQVCVKVAATSFAVLRACSGSDVLLYLAVPCCDLLQDCRAPLFPHPLHSCCALLSRLRELDLSVFYLARARGDIPSTQVPVTRTGSC
jgi:hypothetical protein